MRRLDKFQFEIVSVSVKSIPSMGKLFHELPGIKTVPVKQRKM